MANPTRRWDTVPVFGVWMRANDDSPEHGVVHLETTERIQTADGRIIYPAGARVSVTIGDQSAQDPAVRAAVRAAWRAVDEDLDGEDFDAEAWDTWWDTVILPAAVFTRFPAADDPDIATTGWQVRVQEALVSARGREYYITPLLAHLDEPVPGVNLGSVAVPPGSPVAPAPVYMKGLAGGVAPLDLTGKVPAEHLPDGIGGGGIDEEALAEWVDEHVVPTIPTTPGDIGAVPTTRTVAGKPLSSDVTITAGDIGAVPTSRTVAGKPLSSDVTLSASDVGAVPTSRTVAGKALSSNVTLSASDITGLVDELAGKVDASEVSAGLTGEDDDTIPRRDGGRIKAEAAVDGDDVVNKTQMETALDGRVPTTRTVNGQALTSDVSLTASDVSAVPTTRTVNGKSLSTNVTLDASDVGAVPTTRTVNGKALSANVTLGAFDVTALPLTLSEPVVRATAADTWPTLSSLGLAGFSGTIIWDHTDYGVVSAPPPEIRAGDRGRWLA